MSCCHVFYRPQCIYISPSRLIPATSHHRGNKLSQLMTPKSSLNSACSTFLTTSVRLPQINYRPGSLLSLPVKNISNQWIFWHSYRQKVDCVVHFLHLRAVWWPGNHLLVCNFAKYSPILKFLSLADSAINLS